MKKYLNPCESGTQFCPKLIEIFNGDTFHAAKENSTALPIKSDYTFIRIVDGTGVVILKSAEFSVSSGDIIITDSKDFSDISSNASYWVMRFNSASTPPVFEKKTVYSVAFSSDENELLSKLFDSKEWDEKLFSSFCSSIFSLYYLELAGKYCRSETPATPYHREICSAIEYIKQHYDSVGVAELSEMLHLSERMFRKIFSAETGSSPNAYIQKVRLGKAKEMLKDSSLSIGDVSDALGYSSQFHFCLAFKKAFGLSPSAYRKTPSVIL